MSLLELQTVSVNYGDETAVNDVSLTIKQGEITCLLGPSGSGKSTILRAIAGFESIICGEIKMQSAPASDAEVLSDSTFTLPPEKRQMGMMFQDLALFPHLNIKENILFGIRNWRHQDQQERLDELLQLVGLKGFENRYPHSLSGGQQQRIALARAMAPRPRLLLLDEPFSGLDAAMREVLMPEIRDILLKEKISALLITHDQMDAFAMADQVAVINHGKVIQSDTSYDLYHTPQTRFVADFIGEGDFLCGTVLSSNEVKTSLGILNGAVDRQFNVNQTVDVFVRPDDLLHDDDSEITAEIISKQFRGSHFLYRVKLASKQTLFCFASSHHNHAIGEHIGVKLDLDHLVLFAQQEQ